MPPKEGPPDPLASEKKALSDRVFRLRQHPNAHGNQVVQDSLSDILNEIRTASTTLHLDVIDAGLAHIEKNVLNP